MRVKIRVGQNADDVGWALAKIFGIVVVLSAMVSSGTKTTGGTAFGGGTGALLPASIHAARVDTLTVSSAARVRRILASPGQTVRAGQLLAELESEEVVRQAESARRRLSAAQPRAGEGGITELDARSALGEGIRRQEELKVTAPHDGVVVGTVLAAGDRVSAGTPIVHVADQSKLSFEASVTPLMARKIKPGDPVRIRVPTVPPRQLDAQVSTVALASDPAQQSYIVRAIIANPDFNAILVGKKGAIELRRSAMSWRGPF